MPTYNQASFIKGAIISLKLQSFKHWELIIINDGSTDSTENVLEEFLSDERIVYRNNPENYGLGRSINIGLEKAKYDIIAYLPSDDILYSNHLEELYNTLINDNETILAYSGIKHSYKDTAFGSNLNYINGKVNTSSLQLVQVIHKKTDARWIERDSLVTDELGTMFWNKFLLNGEAVSTNKVTAEWVAHPGQRHRIINEALGGGINTYRQYYNVQKPLKFKSSFGSYTDEPTLYKNFRAKFNSPDGATLKILFVGELAYNPERVYAFEERGHKLYGLWIKSPGFFNAVGHLPFGNVEDISGDNWVERIKEIKPDVIYALLNHHAVPLAHSVLKTNLGIPFIWHFKEGPFFCRNKGTWNELMDLYTLSDGQIYTNPESKEWFSQFLNTNETCNYILDGDLPKKDWFTEEISPLLSDTYGGIHTVVPGRPLGIQAEHMEELAKQQIHLHFYGNFHHNMGSRWIKELSKTAGDFLHLHNSCDQQSWVKEFSQYDAGWLHFFESDNRSEILRSSWNDLNYPARMSTLAAAGLPMIQKDNTGHNVAIQTLCRQLETGVFVTTIEDLGKQLRNKRKLKEIRNKVWKNRMVFTFDYHADDLLDFFRKIIHHKKEKEKKFSNGPRL